VTINFLISQKDCLKRWVDNQNNHYKYNILKYKEENQTFINKDTIFYIY